MSTPDTYHAAALGLTLTCIPDELWEGEALGPDGVYGISCYTPDNEPPIPMQLEALHWAVSNLPKLRQAAINYVRADVQADLAKYGLLDEQGRPYWETYTDMQPWAMMDESAYDAVFKLISLQILEDLTDSQSLVLGFATELDIKHGVYVQFENGVIITTEMLCDF